MEIDRTPFATLAGVAGRLIEFTKAVDHRRATGDVSADELRAIAKTTAIEGARPEGDAERDNVPR